MEEYIFTKKGLKIVILDYSNQLSFKKCFICDKRVKISNINKHLIKCAKKNKKELKINNYSLINVIFE